MNMLVRVMTWSYQFFDSQDASNFAKYQNLATDVTTGVFDLIIASFVFKAIYVYKLHRCDTSEHWQRTNRRLHVSKVVFFTVYIIIQSMIGADKFLQLSDAF